MFTCRCPKYGGGGHENFGDIANLAFRNSEDKDEWKESQLIRITECDKHKLVVRLGKMHLFKLI